MDTRFRYPPRTEHPSAVLAVVVTLSLSLAMVAGALWTAWPQRHGLENAGLTARSAPIAEPPHLSAAPSEAERTPDSGEDAVPEARPLF